MNTDDTLIGLFRSGAGLQMANADDAIFIGTMLPAYSAAGFDAVMRTHTQTVDDLLSLSGLTLMERIELTAMRGFTFHEYTTALFDLTIKEKDFDKYPIFKALFLASDKERREKVIYLLDRNSHGDYQRLLEKVFRYSHPSMAAFLFDNESIS